VSSTGTSHILQIHFPPGVGRATRTIHLQRASR
jgi:hypothetical protein